MMLDEFGLTPEQRAQHLADARKQLALNAKRNRGYASIPIDTDDEELVLRWKMLKDKLDREMERIREDAIARNNRQPTTPHICSPVSDSPRESNRGLVAKIRRFLGL